MRYFLMAAFIIIMPASVLANDFGVSISIGQPGFYGQINLGNNYPRPQLIYPQPILVREIRSNAWAHQSPIYLHVPPSHAHNWHQHCHRYQACNQSVYFVRENWYNDVYAPQYNSQPNRRHTGYQGQYDNAGGYNDNYQDRGYDSHNQGKRHDQRERRHSNDKQHGKHDKGHHGKQNHDRGHGKH